MAGRLVVVDDIDPRITYSENWVQATVQQDSTGGGASGPIFNGTHHYTTTNETQFAFSFEGTEFTLYGRSETTRLSDGSYSPALNCIVDGVAISVPWPPGNADNQPLCGVGSLVDGLHDVVAIVTTRGEQFYFDYVRYVPSSKTDDISLQKETLFIDNDNHSIVYDGVWLGIVKTPGVIPYPTASQRGAMVKFNFTGTGVTWFGVLRSSDLSPAHTISSSGTYAVDGTAETTFTIPWRGASQTNQPLFSAINLPTGSHSLSVTYEGDLIQVPLILDYLIVAPNLAASTNIPSASTTSSSSITNTDSGHNSSKAKLPTGAIVGGALGEVVVIIFFCLLWLLYWRKRSSRPPHRLSLIQDEGDTMVLPEPFIASPLEPGAPVTNRPSSPSMRQADLTPGSPTTDVSRSSSPAFPSSLGSSTPYGQARSVTTESSRTGLAPSAKVDTASRLRLVHHEDSGSRFDGIEETVVDIPPGYTPN